MDGLSVAPWIAAPIIAAVLSGVLTGIARRIAPAIGLVDNPDGRPQASQAAHAGDGRRRVLHRAVSGGARRRAPAARVDHRAADGAVRRQLARFRRAVLCAGRHRRPHCDAAALEAAGAGHRQLAFCTVNPACRYHSFVGPAHPVGADLRAVHRVVARRMLECDQPHRRPGRPGGHRGADLHAHGCSTVRASRPARCGDVGAHRRGQPGRFFDPQLAAGQDFHG